ncbi:MAG: cellulose biosynthesis protein BcsS, partial [Afipia sp.]|nr:cellulose biosynthesis protein BcsS [Afipia sp.]
WAEPTKTTMASANVSFATVGDSYWSPFAYGWRAFERVYIGPEVHAMGDETYRQWRIGVHATALKVGNYEWSFGAGYVDDSDDRSGLYGRIGVLLRR